MENIPFMKKLLWLHFGKIWATFYSNIWSHWWWITVANIGEKLYQFIWPKTVPTSKEIFQRSMNIFVVVGLNVTRDKGLIQFILLYNCCWNNFIIGQWLWLSWSSSHFQLQRSAACLLYGYYCLIWRTTFCWLGWGSMINGGLYLLSFRDSFLPRIS